MAGAGALLSLALVADSGEEFYVVVEHEGPLEQWVERNVVPFRHGSRGASKPAPVAARRAEALAFFLVGDPDPLIIIADWPEDIAHFASLLVTGPGLMVPLPNLRFQLVALTGFSTAANSSSAQRASRCPRAFRDHLTALD